MHWKQKSNTGKTYLCYNIDAWTINYMKTFSAFVMKPWKRRCHSVTPVFHPNTDCWLICLSLCSCVSPHMYEWRCMQLEETLPVSARLRWTTLPGSTAADTASSGCARQQAARLPHIAEARQSETRGASEHRAYSDDTNALNFHPTLDTSRTPLTWRYLCWPDVLDLYDGSDGKLTFTHMFSSVFSADQCTRSPHARHVRGHSTFRPIRRQASSQDRATANTL